ncbi:mitochondrial matrix Mmp37-domain-containing protein [Zopfochytrium polystomum]|nr:mitochondrial matrix Mmp37-domain-containing protein [Zopfochytrium polystomum]
MPPTPFLPPLALLRLPHPSSVRQCCSLFHVRYALFWRADPHAPRTPSTPSTSRRTDSPPPSSSSLSSTPLVRLSRRYATLATGPPQSPPPKPPQPVIPTPPAEPQNLQQDSASIWADDRLVKLLDHFDGPIRFAAGYGSGVLRQAGYETGSGAAKSPPMVDLIFGVTHPYHWHSLNMRQHRDHYSFLASAGSKTVALVQDKYGAGLYYNTHVVIDGIKIKYGVISMERLLKDLTEWETLYIAGRMQKPIKILRGDSRIKLANEVNLMNATRMALLMLPNEFSEFDFYRAIVGLSYMGDFRMTVGAENPHKIHNIIATQLPQLRSLYAPIIDALPNLAVSTSPLTPEIPAHKEDPRGFNRVEFDEGVLMRQDDDPKARAALVRELPKGVRSRLEAIYANKSGGGRAVVSDIIRGPAFWQSTKGLLTAGAGKSLRYMGEKLSKAFSGRSANA